ncbi:MAG: tetraacyldisaccharide 4'-kinase, partial [Planctomycetota bacterium]|nr:tetraacyldisaccharide 4'-kinase [Planctomycetota bacterium]
MTYQIIRGILACENQSSGAKFLRALLWPFGQVYGAAMALRAFAYRKRWLRSFAVPAPVISIGNLASGGTGKTPFTAFLCRRLVGLGRKPAILLRGYGARRGTIPDEALWLAQHAAGALVQVDADRVRGALAALRAGADVLVLDDGFQHLRLRRDLDIALIDSMAPWPGFCPLPAGLLREFPQA